MDAIGNHKLWYEFIHSQLMMFHIVNLILKYLMKLQNHIEMIMKSLKMKCIIMVMMIVQITMMAMNIQKVLVILKNKE